ncbi:hypothetical protein DT076_13845 [Desertihabitans brevis]|uniref:Uncharacterized protein n=1 Tax=Desertihabitans brevis TaxID=2268447 RepID=A0A367YT10_9ACTN|nr:hypothetical protein DT076_13845 [Desertihabitans brevis]
MGELTYTSFDAPGAAGGWQVKEQRGFTDPALRQHVVQRIRTTGPATRPLPPFPTAEQRTALPRTLVYDRRGRTAVWWHTVAAGADGSGRPGNVFAHVLAVEQDAPSRRPVEWWRSPDWLTPYGPAEVAAAVLGPRPPGPGTVVDRFGALDWLAGDDRAATLGVLLDGLVEARRRGVALVLLVPDDDTAACWVGALSQVLALPQAAALTFSTGETAARVRSGEADELAVVCLAGAEADALQGATPPVLVDLRTPPAAPPAPSGWARLARSAVAEPALLELMDAAVARVGGAGDDPAWPLALAHLWYLDAEEDVADPELAGLREVATGTVLRASPEALAEDAELLRVVTGALERTSPDPASAWQRLRPLLDAPATVPARVLGGIYADRLLTDPSALAELQQDTRLGLPPAVWWQDRPPRPDLQRVAALAREQRRDADDEPARRLAVVLGLTRLLTSTGTPWPDTLEDDLSELLQETWRAPGASWLPGVGVLPEPATGVAQRAYDTDPVVQQSPVGTGDPEVLRWLFAPGAPPVPTTRAEVEHWLAVPADERSEEVVLALLRFLLRPRPGTDLDATRQVLDALVDRPWTAAGLAAAGAAELSCLLDRRLTDLVLTEPDSSDLRRLLDRLWRADRLRDLVELRQAVLHEGARGLGLDAVARLDHVDLLRRLATGPCPPDLVGLAQTVLLDAVLRGAALPAETEQLVRAAPELTGPAARWLAHRPPHRREVYRVLRSDPRTPALAGSPAGPEVHVHRLHRDGQPALRWWVLEQRLGRDQLQAEYETEHRRSHGRAPEERVVGAVVRSYVSRQGVADLLRRRPWGERG